MIRKSRSLPQPAAPGRLAALLTAAGLPALLVFGAILATGFSAGQLPGDSQPAHESVMHRLLQVGKASWYGLRFQGHKTATGEAFDMNDLTCAHPRLPLGSWLRVTNLRNHRSVVVRVNDRGPLLSGRIVDLSYAAARAVGIRGVAQVSIEPAAGPDFDGPRPLIARLHMPASLLNLSIPAVPGLVPGLVPSLVPDQVPQPSVYR